VIRQITLVYAKSITIKYCFQVLPISFGSYANSTYTAREKIFNPLS
jgi:hypothetical protein